ncbi:mechanosensitive ion channel domain-containing protein [Rhabdothermincola salaria]|uniref:mechanosensitive ion channel domain-containing protein n=1 Tax=Rhabdothermincola salaria TaxID=2903142 RepID=UPI001E6013E1|nr:mechanosensitive ion channel domain-containing protein [Rhabdothermincola salaria]MCD9625148.1 mechanosensitive ion channel [Rhabdothermincola salaria]
MTLTSSPPAWLAQATTTTEAENPAAGALESLRDPSQACGEDPSWACRWIYDWTGSDAWAGVADWILAKPIAIVIILALAWIAGRLLRTVVGRIVTKMGAPAHSQRLARLRARAPAGLVSDDEQNLRAQARANTLAAVARSLTTGFVWFVALVAILDVIEINLGPLLAGAGIVGVALGFGAQQMVQDYLSGFFLVIEDQYGVGDWVDLGPEAQGVVERVTLRATRVRGVDGTVWHVPNGEVRRVGNYTQDFAYAVLDVQVSLDVDVTAVERMITEIAERLAADESWRPDITGTPDLWGVNVLTREGATVRLLLKTAPGAQWRVQRELKRRVKNAFHREGLTSSLAGQPAPVTVGSPVADRPPGADAGASHPIEDDERPRPDPSTSGETAVARDSMEVAADLERQDEQVRRGHGRHGPDREPEGTGTDTRRPDPPGDAEGD